MSTSGSYSLPGGLARRFLNKARTKSDSCFKGKEWRYELLTEEEEDIRSGSGQENRLHLETGLKGSMKEAGLNGDISKGTGSVSKIIQVFLFTKGLWK